jgi:tetratricopeptide (TPR) repeat protein
LGKAYYEEKRDKLATGQYEMAKSLDPSDPTPYFYDAIEKQTTNRPVEALRDMEKSMELNDNRAVYRSRLLLDQDIATRAASLARVYNDLGFQELALVEGYKSVNTDPANYSAHRFLADSYLNMPRTQIARVSELLQAQLLQPINISPIQPSLGESNLLAISGGGPANPSFGEYNPLFERNRNALQLNGILGQQNTAGGEVVGSMLANNISASAGYYGFQTDGFRTNDDVKDTIFNLFTQASLSPKTSIQAEYRNRDSQYGFLQLRALPDDFSSTRRFEKERESVRLGFHHAFSPGSDLIGNLMYSKEKWLVTEVIDPVYVPLFEDKIKNDAKSAELSYLLTRENFKLITGAGYFSISGEDQINISILGILIDPTLPPDEYIIIPSTLNNDTKHKNIYAYLNVNYPKNVTFTIGGSYDDFSSESDVINKKTQFNPKFGITWNPVSATTIRAAAFKVLKRTLITDQTLEPTQVAGFNQFYDDDNGTEYWKYGLAIDQKFSKSVWGGAEYTWRDMTVPFVSLDSLTGASSLEKVDWKEENGRVYLFWTPTTWLALNGGYSYEHLKRDKQFALGASDVTTQRVPLGANFFHPSGLSAIIKAIHYDQHGSFEPIVSDGTFTDASDKFWVCNAAISYRLPQRYGFLSVGATNLFNQSFNYFDSDLANPAIQPVRTFFARVTLSL